MNKHIKNINKESNNIMDSLADFYNEDSMTTRKQLNKVFQDGALSIRKSANALYMKSVTYEKMENFITERLAYYESFVNTFNEEEDRDAQSERVKLVVEELEEMKKIMEETKDD